MAGLTVNERAVHLNPMTGNVQSNDELEPEHVFRVEDTQHHDQTGCGAPSDMIERWVGWRWGP